MSNKLDDLKKKYEELGKERLEKLFIEKEKRLKNIRYWEEVKKKSAERSNSKKYK